METLTSIDALRRAVIAEARTWLGTPFHDCAGVKGAGVDCAYLLIRVYAAVGIIENFDPPPYPPQWFMHRDEPRFLNTLAKYAHRVDVPEMGDVVMFKFGRHASHGGILIGPNAIIHAYAPIGRVTFGSLSLPRGVVDSYWSVF